MIARENGRIVLVGGAIPGERVTARIDRIGRGVAYAQVVGVESPSPDRRDPFTDPMCGGCLYAHIAYPRQLEIKGQVIADAFARVGHIPLPSPVAVAGSRDDGYRMRARLHVRGRRIGFFREGSHDLCDARATRQLLPQTCDVLDAIRAALQSLGTTNVRELELSENLEASQRVVHLETEQPGARGLQAVGLTPGLTGLTTTPSHVLAGDPHVVDRMTVDGRAITLRRHVLAFFQGNRYLLNNLVSHVASQIAPEDDVIDLYAGAGLFSVAAAARGARVTAVEGDRASAIDLKANAAAWNGAVEAIHQPVEAFTAAPRRGPAVLIVDPPRTGMSKEALQGALTLQARRIVYVSCDVATLARDARRILDAGYAVQRVEAFDLFPNTPHVECVVEFLRERSP